MTVRKTCWIARPLVWASAFVGFDLLWLLALIASVWLPSSDPTSALEGTAWAWKIWNAYHAPVDHLVRPLLFPVITPHMEVSWVSVVLLYGASILQSAFVGWIAGAGVRELLRNKCRTGQASSS